MTGVSARQVAAVVWLARSDPRMAMTPEQFDRDPWLFNTRGGTVELKTGKMREHRRLDYITKITEVIPGGDCPMFLDFLDTIFAKDNELIAYLQKFFGYILTGETTEHAMLFFYGTGANGKSVLVSTLAGILGEYHRVAPIDTFTVTNMIQHPTDMACMQGARLVTAVETEDGRRWAESKIKALTGGDKITARFMRGDFFEFVPAFKLIIAGNHKPSLRSVDEAMRRRLYLIPFNVTIPPEERDKHLADKLKAEWPGILQWMIDGCLKWQREGLSPPQSVTNATAEYLQSEDTFATWIEERCELKPSYTDTSESLFASWKEWAELMGEPAISRKKFNSKLESRLGIERTTIGHKKTRGYSGIRVITVATAWHDG
jgi:putative DNA primase/helicase